jgi:hypothetical protein
MVPMGIDIQGRMARAISAIEQNAGVSGGTSSMAKQFDNFLVAARTAIAGFIDAVAPTVSSRLTGVLNPADSRLPNQIIRIRCSKWLDRSFVPAVTAFAVASPVKAIQRVEIDGPDILITVDTPFTTGQTPTIAYTQPGAATNIRDLSGNLLATFAATALTSAAP